jgi:adenosine kinase
MALSAENDISGVPAAWGIVAPDAKEGMFAHARRLNAQGIPFVFDLGQAMPLFSGDDINEMLLLAQILAVNEYEASVVEQRTGRSMSQIAELLQAVVVTHGANGATLYADGVQTHIQPIKVAKVVDPTGCGDAHRAGLLYGLTKQWSLADACRLANVMGAFKIASRGPQNHRPSKVQIQESLEQHYGLSLLG